MRSGHSPVLKHLNRQTTQAKTTSHIPPPPLLSAYQLSQIISVLDDRINRIILSPCLLSQNCMATLLVDRNSVSISKQEIIFCLLCGAENSTGKFLISMKGTLELTERKSNSFLLSFSISCLAQKNYPDWQSHSLLSLIQYWIWDANGKHLTWIAFFIQTDPRMLYKCCMQMARGISSTLQWSVCVPTEASENRSGTCCWVKCEPGWNAARTLRSRLAFIWKLLAQWPRWSGLWFYIFSKTM